MKHHFEGFPATAHPMAILSSMINAAWDEALDRAAEGYRRARDEHGRHAVYAIASGRAPHESAYSVQKFIRAGFGSNYVDNCSRA
jgi:formate dehydrogenase major subunit